MKIYTYWYKKHNRGTVKAHDSYDARKQAAIKLTGDYPEKRWYEISQSRDLMVREGNYT